MALELNTLSECMWRGRELEQADDLVGAADVYERALELEPDDTEAMIRLGMLYTELFEVEEAEAALQRAIEVDAAQAPAWAQLGRIRMRQSRFDEAEEWLEKALEIDPHYEPALADLCWVNRRLGNFEKAVNYGRAALEINPDDEAHNYLTAALLAADQAQDAVAVCDQSLSANPHNTSALFYKHSALARLDRQADGRKLLDFETLLWEALIKAPKEFSSLQTFNDALAELVMQTPSRPMDATQTRDLMKHPAPAMQTLARIINQAVSHYFGNLPRDPDHPFLSQRPESWSYHAWGTRLASFQPNEHHYHQHAWLSGVYYVRVPPGIGATNTELDGCIEFCRFQAFSSAPVESEFAVIKPEPGVLVLFPAYFPHRIRPFIGDQTRISIAFNLIPDGWGFSKRYA